MTNKKDEYITAFEEFKELDKLERLKVFTSLRQIMNIKQHQLSIYLNVSRGTIINWESSKYIIKDIYLDFMVFLYMEIEEALNNISKLKLEYQTEESIKDLQEENNITDLTKPSIYINHNLYNTVVTMATVKRCRESL